MPQKSSSEISFLAVRTRCRLKYKTWRNCTKVYSRSTALNSAFIASVKYGSLLYRRGIDIVDAVLHQLG